MASRSFPNYLGNLDAEGADAFRQFAGCIDPHLPPYGAKGDAFFAADGMADGSTRFVTASHRFTRADIGKLLYTDASPTPLTITDVNPDNNPNACLLGGAVPKGANRAFLFGTDDTAALQHAIDDAMLDSTGHTVGPPEANTRNLTFGREVLLRSGCAYLIRNTTVERAAGKLAALELRRRTVLRGRGRTATRLFVAPDNIGHGLMTMNGETVRGGQIENAFTDFIQLEQFGIWCFKGFGPRASLDALHLAVSFEGYAYTDAFIRVNDLVIVDAVRDGIYGHGRGEWIISNVHVMQPGRHGIYVEGLNDSVFTHCNVGGAGKAGIRLNGCGGTKWFGCKSYFAGSRGGTIDDDSCAWLVDADQPNNGFAMFVGCEGQETRGSSWVIKTAYCQFVGCLATDAGRNAPQLSGGELPVIRAGFHLASRSAIENVFTDCVVNSGVQVWQDPPFSGTHAVWIDQPAAGNVGTIRVQGKVRAVVSHSLPLDGSIVDRHVVVRAAGHDLRDGDVVMLTDVASQPALNGKRGIVKVIDRDRFTLPDLGVDATGPIPPGGKVVKMPFGGAGTIGPANAGLVVHTTTLG